MKKILVATTNFGLGPVGKLYSIVNAGKEKFEWYACGQKFDFGIFEENIFRDSCWTMDKYELQEFINKNNIKIALVVLKNKMARILKDIGMKVIYVDSLPFMWTLEDYKQGKVPVDMDAYCAQKTLSLDSKSSEIFKNVNNVKWINPILPVINQKENNSKEMEKDYILINLGGLHSPVGTGEEYIKAVINPLIQILIGSMKKTEKIYITCGTEAERNLKRLLSMYPSVKICTLTQNNFIEKIKYSKLFITSPGLTTILETLNLQKPSVILPPQNLSQFYNIEFAKEHLKVYKIIEWNDDILSLKYLKNIDKIESEIVKKIYNRIKELSETKDLKNEIIRCMDDEFIINNNFKKIKNGTLEVINILEEV